MATSSPEQPTRTPDFMRQAMDAYGDMVVRIALSYTHSYHDAQDVAQDVFMRLLTSKMCFTSSEHLMAWLIRCAVNRCHELRRSWWSQNVTSNASQVDNVADTSSDEPPGSSEAYRPTPESPVEAAAVAALTRHHMMTWNLHSSTPLPPRGPSLAARSSELAQSPRQPGPPSWDSRSLGSRREKTSQQGKTNWQPL